MTLTSTIINFKNKIKRTLFTTPSHGQGDFIVPDSKKIIGKKYFESDFSEIDGFDNIRDPQNVMREMLCKASEIYDTNATFFLTNGSSSGIIALFLAILNPRDRVLINRNAHISICSALALCAAEPIWIDSEKDEDWGIIRPITAEQVEKAITKNPDAKAFVITSPTYEGMIAPIGDIAQICKKYNILLIVDEAHGALWNFSEKLPSTAIAQGADASVQSLHKTAGAINPAAVLHISKNSKLSPAKVQEALNLITTTSPSYPLIANIEQTVEFLYSDGGSKKIDELLKNIRDFHKQALQFDNVSIYCIGNDITKILIRIEEVSGYALESCLFDKFNIEVELENAKSVMCLTGLGTTKSKIKKLQKAICKIAKNPDIAKQYETEIKDPVYKVPTLACSPYQAFHARSNYIELDKAEGKISKQNHIAYPPGIPFLFAGEIITKEHISYLKENCDKIEVIA